MALGKFPRFVAGDEIKNGEAWRKYMCIIEDVATGNKFYVDQTCYPDNAYSSSSEYRMLAYCPIPLPLVEDVLAYINDPEEPDYAEMD